MRMDIRYLDVWSHAFRFKVTGSGEIKVWNLILPNFDTNTSNFDGWWWWESVRVLILFIPSSWRVANRHYRRLWKFIKFRDLRFFITNSHNIAILLVDNHYCSGFWETQKLESHDYREQVEFDITIFYFDLKWIPDNLTHENYSRIFFLFGTTLSYNRKEQQIWWTDSKGRKTTRFCWLL